MASTRSGPAAGAARSEGGAEPPNGPTTATGGSALIDLEFVRALIEAVDESGIDTLEISRGGTRVRISKSPVPSAVIPAAAVPAPTAAAAATPVPAAATGSVPAVAATVEPAVTGPVHAEIKSPMVGTFYRAPAPEAPPYVEVGNTVSPGQTLCILEAMKLMNELECEIDGVVREVLVENGDPVEFGQVLFRIEQAGTA